MTSVHGEPLLPPGEVPKRDQASPTNLEKTASSTGKVASLRLQFEGKGSSTVQAHVSPPPLSPEAADQLEDESLLLESVKVTSEELAEPKKERSPQNAYTFGRIEELTKNVHSLVEKREQQRGRLFNKVFTFFGRKRSTAGYTQKDVERAKQLIRDMCSLMKTAQNMGDGQEKAEALQQLREALETFNNSGVFTDVRLDDDKPFLSMYADLHTLFKEAPRSSQQPSSVSATSFSDESAAAAAPTQTLTAAAPMFSEAVATFRAQLQDPTYDRNDHINILRSLEAIQTAAREDIKNNPDIRPLVREKMNSLDQYVHQRFSESRMAAVDASVVAMESSADHQQATENLRFLLSHMTGQERRTLFAQANTLTDATKREVRQLIKDENVDRMLRTATNPEILKTEMMRETDEQERGMLEKVAHNADIALPTYIGNRKQTLETLLTFVKSHNETEQVSHATTLLLKLAEEWNKLPPRKHEDPELEAEITNLFSEIAITLLETHEVDQAQKRALENIRQKGPITEEKQTPSPAQTSAKALIAKAIKKGEGRHKKAYSMAVSTVASDLFAQSANVFVHLTPSALTLKNEVSMGSAFQQAATYSNQLAAFISANISSQKSLPDTRKASQFWHLVAQKCLEMGDFISAEAISSGLSGPVKLFMKRDTAYEEKLDELSQSLGKSRTLIDERTKNDRTSIPPAQKYQTQAETAYEIPERGSLPQTAERLIDTASHINTHQDTISKEMRNHPSKTDLGEMIEKEHVLTDEDKDKQGIDIALRIEREAKSEVAKKGARDSAKLRLDIEARKMVSKASAPKPKTPPPRPSREGIPPQKHTPPDYPLPPTPEKK